MKRVLGFLILFGGAGSFIAFLASQTSLTAVAIAVGIATGIALWIGTALWLILDWGQ